ncbi:MAG: rhodanese-like domain-containing protein, partial [Clostridiales bacterium]|nr:rhodanese-like domain-containing protein [Clostridiales bacterium]
GNTQDVSIEKASYKKLTAEQAKAIIDSGQPYILLDVRTVSEYNEKRINGAISIPVDEIDKKANSELPDKSALIMVYCLSGVRSSSAAKLLISKGYTNIYDIGGIRDWPYDTVDGQ